MTIQEILAGIEYRMNALSSELTVLANDDSSSENLYDWNEERLDELQTLYQWIKEGMEES